MNGIINSTSPAFFLGANTPEGFYSLFSELYDPEDGWRLYILKGGPGTGKSSVMKKIAAEAEKRGLYCERVYCSSDPDSLDAVIIPRLKVSIADGTLPHAIEPRFPGVSEKIVDLGAFRNDRLLSEYRETVIEKTLENSAEHKKCVGFMRAAAAAAADNRILLSAGADVRKIKNFSYHLARSIFSSESSCSGKTSRRFLSALTPAGYKMFSDTVNAVCEKKIVLDDGYGVAAPMMIKILADLAREAGFGVTECMCPMRPVMAEHIIVPELSLGVFTSNRYHRFDIPAEKTVRCTRFFTPQVLREHRNRISFNVKAQNEFLDEAVKKLQNAKQIHDELEKIYISSMNFDGVNEKARELISEIFE